MIAILFGVGAFLLAIGHFAKKRAPHAFLKALVAGVIGWVVAIALFSIGKFVIGVAFIALAVLAVVLLARRFIRDTGAP